MPEPAPRAARSPRPASRPAAGSRPAAAGLRVSVCDPRGRPVRAPGLAAWLAGVSPARLRGTATVVLAGDAAARRLNRVWRGIDRATDVLSFPAGEPEPGAGRRPAAGPGGRHLGDIVIATGVAARQARRLGHGVAAELRVLALHGLLHLVGYDHDRDDGRMARVERRLRRQGGLAAGLIERTPGSARRRA